MNTTQFWKNFTLGDELHIAGRFIYNGLRTFHEMDTLHYEDEVFEVLYNLSVGLGSPDIQSSDSRGEC